MVSARIYAGLGNQLFQYACGRALSIDLGVPLELDVSWFLYGNRPLKLAEFGPVGRVYPGVCDGRAKPPSLPQRVVRRLTREARNRRLLKDEERGFDPRVPASKDGVVLQGYWQSPRYFEHRWAEIRGEFRCRRALPPEAENLARRMEDLESVAVHVRRGDYVDMSALYRLPGPEYYGGALAAVRDRVEKPRYFVFSDDAEAAKAALGSVQDVEYVGLQGEHADLWEFQLMSRCRHHVIANSTFSWWAAWLASRPGQVVVSPAEWFNGRATPADDLLPASWLRL